MAKEDFYLNVMDLDTLLFHSKLLLKEYENGVSIDNISNRICILSK